VKVALDMVVCYVRHISINTPSGPSRMTSAPLLLKFEAPSTDKIHTRDDSSTTKSTNTCALMHPMGTKVMSNSDSSIDHATIRPTKSGFLRTCFIG
jgi:hypothetical protein